MAVELDDLDLRIVNTLLRDGRAPAAQIAEQIGLSRPAVADRIEKLERQGVIRGTTVVVEPRMVGDCYLIKVRTGSIPSLNALVSRPTAAPLSLTTRTTIVMQTHVEKVGGMILGEVKA